MYFSTSSNFEVLEVPFGLAASTLLDVVVACLLLSTTSDISELLLEVSSVESIFSVSEEISDTAFDSAEEELSFEWQPLIRQHGHNHANYRKPIVS